MTEAVPGEAVRDCGGDVCPVRSMGLEFCALVGSVIFQTGQMISREWAAGDPMVFADALITNVAPLHGITPGPNPEEHRKVSEAVGRSLAGEPCGECAGTLLFADEEIVPEVFVTPKGFTDRASAVEKSVLDRLLWQTRNPGGAMYRDMPDDAIAERVRTILVDGETTPSIQLVADIVMTYQSIVEGIYPNPFN